MLMAGLTLKLKEMKAKERQGMLTDPAYIAAVYPHLARALPDVRAAFSDVVFAGIHEAAPKLYDAIEQEAAQQDDRFQPRDKREETIIADVLEHAEEIRGSRAYCNDRAIAISPHHSEKERKAARTRLQGRVSKMMLQ
jgi:hypothetical protein